MFVSAKFAFLELHKTGTSQIRRILGHLIEGSVTGSHNQAAAALFNSERIFLGSIRNPWDWYASLWAYGCGGNGQMFHNLTASGHEAWADTYTDVNDTERFRTWLQMLLDPVYADDIGEAYSAYPLHLGSGLMTFRYLWLFCNRRGESNGLKQVLLYEQLRDYEQSNNFIDYFIRNETLEEDVFAALERYDSPVSDEDKAEVLAFDRLQATPRNRDLHYYYDRATEELVAHKERLIIEKFAYVFPGTQ